MRTASVEQWQNCGRCVRSSWIAAAAGVGWLVSALDAATIDDRECQRDREASVRQASQKFRWNELLGATRSGPGTEKAQSSFYSGVAFPSAC